MMSNIIIIIAIVLAIDIYTNTESSVLALNNDTTTVSQPCNFNNLSGKQ